MKNDNDLNLDFIVSRRYKLTESTLNEVADEIQKKYDIEVLGIVETEDGYVFRGKYDFTIGDLTYDIKQGRYSKFNYHRGVKESIKEKDAAMKRASRRKYKVQRKRIGVALTASAVALFVGIGVIKGINNNNQKTETIRTESVAVASHLNTIHDANDLILVAWANYAMGGVTDFCESSELDVLQGMNKEVYINIFAPIMSSYYNYLDCVDSPLPEDIIGSSLENNHEAFRQHVITLNEQLKAMNLNSYTFASSPFADAVVFDENGNIVVSNERYKGEVKNADGDLVTYDGDENYNIYIRAVDVPNNNYSITNLPADAKLYNGETYVDYTHLFKVNEVDQKVSK